MGTFTPSAKTVNRQWHIIDADGLVLGRIATQAARLLQGKHKAEWTPFLDRGDHVIVVNASKVKLTGNKEQELHGKVKQVQGAGQEGLGDIQDAVRELQDKDRDKA